MYMCSARIVTLFDLDSTHHYVGGTPFRCLTLSVSFSHVPCCSAIACTHGPLTALLPSVHTGTSNLYILAATVQHSNSSTLLNSAAANTTSATVRTHACLRGSG
jgi:hypothetical protein